MTEGNATWLTDGLGMVDLKFRGADNLIAAYLLDTSDGLLLIETGPANAQEWLLAGVRQLGRDPSDIRHIAVTHIHLDHAAAAGALMEQFPEARLYVHEIGARHMIDPSRLLNSAYRIYGEQMEALWGIMKPAPADRVTSLADGDTLEIGNLHLDVVYTPGHASHHVSYVDPQRGVVFAGDVAGVRIPPSGVTYPPTPPPDIDVPLWHESVGKLRELDPQQLLLTHFGPVDDVTGHLDQLEERLDRWVGLVSEFLDQGLEREEMVDRLAEQANQEMLDAGESTDAQASVSNVTPFGMAIDGLTRYLRKKAS